MTDMSAVDERLKWFVEQMRSKLSDPKNLAKGDWRKDTDLMLLKKIEDEFKELREEVLSLIEPNPERIIKECADVANFCFMLADYVRSHPDVYKE